MLFSKLYDRLKELEINLIIRDIRKLKGQIEDIEKERHVIIEEISLIEDEKTSIESKYNLLKNNIENMEKEIDESRNMKLEIIKSLENLRNQVALLNEKEGFLKKDLSRLEEESEKLRNELIDIERLNEDIIKNKDLITATISNINSEFDVKNNDLTNINKFLDEKEKEIETEKNKMLGVYNKSADTRSELNSIISFNENINKRISQLNKEIQSILISKETNSEKQEELSIDKADLESKLKDKLNKVNDLKEISMTLESQYKDVMEKLRSDQMKVQGLISSYNLHRNMEEGYEGYYKSVKSLLMAIKKSDTLKKGFLGVIADLLKVDSRYERAIDISLGSSLQNIVVETDRDAKSMIEYLKKYKLGRVTFLPLNTIKGTTLNLNKNDLKEYKILGLGHELITYDAKYNNIFEFLLGRTIIIEDIDNAIRFAKKYNHSYRIVTLEGEVFNPGGSLTGGTYGNNSISIINRKNKILTLEKEINILNDKLSGLENEKSILADKIDKNREIIAKEENLIKSLELELMSVFNEIEKSKDEIKRLEDYHIKLNDEIISLTTESDNLLMKKDDLSNSIKLFEEEINNHKNYIIKLTEEVAKEKSIKDELTNEVTNIRISLNYNENLLKNLEDKLNDNAKESNRIKDLILEKEKNIALNLREVESIGTNKSNILNSIKSIEKEEVDISAKLDKLIETKDNFMKNFYEEQERLKEINKKLGILEKQKNNQEVKLTRLELYLENNHNRLADEYEMDYEKALKFESPIGNIQNAIQEAKSLRAQIKELGHVNLGSIDEYKKVKERLEFNTTQYNDLLESKENLKNVILDMEKTMRVKFKEALAEINENFGEVFSVLFNGGKAAIELDESEDILKSGIEIKAQPPGKKLQSLTLLSGGEKSLTAVALLFALLKSKPSPFCILDEIDAALDEVNITRYTSYLKSFNDGTQFVLITHRKTTMEIADILYGVTMEEEGISKLISVKLKDNLDGIAS